MEQKNMITYYERTNLGPLTTTFTPNPDCSVNAYYGPGQYGVFFQAQSCNSGSIQEAASCRPPVTVTTPSPPLLAWGFYSPGLHCPVGYTSACSSIAQNTSVTDSQTQIFDYRLNSGETAIGCCASGLTCAFGSNVQNCATVFRHGSLTNAGYCPSQGTAFGDVATLTFGASTSTQTGTVPLVVVFAPMIELVFQASDLPTTSSPSTSATIIASTSVPTASSATATSSAADQGISNTGLSTGTKIGIGVGVPLAVLLVAILAIFIWLYRREKFKNKSPVDMAGYSQAYSDKPTHTFQAPVEVQANEAAKYDAHRNGPVELNNPRRQEQPPGYHQIAELSNQA